MMTEKGLYDIYTTHHIPFWQTTWFYSCIVTIISLILLFVVYHIIKKIKARKKTQVPFWEQSLRAIKQLKIDIAQGKQFYAKLTTILKRYITVRYHVNVENKTDDELIAYLADKKLLDELLLDDLRSIFTGSVTIKFANAQAAQEQMERDYSKAINFINKTIEQEVTNVSNN